MVSPFEFDEFPQEASVGSVRLPRRQAGGSPQGLAVTLLADYSLRTRAWLPSSAMVALLGESQVTPGGARTAISRLSRRGALESRRTGRYSFYRLALPAAAALAEGGRIIAAFGAQAEAWDGHWTLIAFSLPQGADTQRRALRGRLRWLGYAPLYDGLWVSPRRLQTEAESAVADIGLGSVTAFRARRICIDAVTDRDPLDAWDLAGVARRYASFVGRWSTLLPGIREGSIRGVDAVRARTEVMESYRYFVALDPFVPVCMMPSGWLREQAREVFEAVYDGLAAPALAHVTEVVSGFVEGQRPDLRTHTVGDLLAGVSPGHRG